MTWLDYAVLGVMGLSVVLGAWRGLVREVVSVAGWVIAFLAANLFAAPLAETLPRSLSPPELRVLVAFVGVFVLSLAVTSLAGLVLAKMVKAVGLGGLDRTLGGLFGVARGLVFALAFALLAGLTRLPLDPIWKQSVSGPLLARAALALKPWLPPAFGDRLRYH
ncbi:MAG: CvpA family protein [Betaproteobacteria bacterium]|nr:MAG: CvpA family protein [Betaproteobacteria bacterium]